METHLIILLSHFYSLSVERFSSLPAVISSFYRIKSIILTESFWYGYTRIILQINILFQCSNNRLMEKNIKIVSCLNKFNSNIDEKCVYCFQSTR